MSVKEISSVNVLKVMMFYFPKTAFKHYTLLALKEMMKLEDAEKIWNKTLAQQRKLALKRPYHSLGTNHLLRYMEWDCALYLAAQEQGIAQSSAKELIEKINWSIFGSANKAVFYISRLRSSQLLTRIDWIINLMFLLIFTAPFQYHKHTNSNEVAFDVTLCPLANYFKEQNVPELTASAACSLDNHMANLWGVTLTRPQTIAQNHPLCEFHFHPKLVKLESAKAYKQ